MIEDVFLCINNITNDFYKFDEVLGNLSENIIKQLFTEDEIIILKEIIKNKNNTISYIINELEMKNVALSKINYEKINLKLMKLYYNYYLINHDNLKRNMN